MQPMKVFVDTHDHRSQTFPAGIGRQDFAEFFASYERFAREEGVVVLGTRTTTETWRSCRRVWPSSWVRHARWFLARCVRFQLQGLITTRRGGVRVVDVRRLERAR